MWLRSRVSTPRSRGTCCLRRKGPQLHECRNLEVLPSLLRQIFAEKQGLAASTAHDAGKGKGKAIRRKLTHRPRGGNFLMALRAAMTFVAVLQSVGLFGLLMLWQIAAISESPTGPTG